MNASNIQDQIELLRKVVRSCYRHLGQEKLLNDSSLRTKDTLENEEEENNTMEAKTTEGATEPPLPVTGQSWALCLLYELVYSISITSALYVLKKKYLL